MNFAIVAIGGSAGALPALQRITAGLPLGFPAAIFVVTHVPPDRSSAMPHILSRCGALVASHGIDGAPVAPAQIIVGPPSHHLAIEPGIIRIVDSAKVNGQRPSIDVLFRSAANAYGERVCGVLLSGTLDDGVAGLEAIKDAGGVTIAQDPNDALFGDLPRKAIVAGAADQVVGSDDLSDAIRSIVLDIVRRATPAGS